MHRILVRIMATLHILEKRVQQQFQPLRLQIQKNWMVRENDINSLSIAIGTNFFQEQVLLCQIANELSSSKCLSSCKGGGDRIGLTSSSDGIFGNFGIQSSGSSTCSSIVVVKEPDLEILLVGVNNQSDSMLTESSSVAK